MTPEEKQMLDMHFKELTKHEVEFLEGEGQGRKNSFGVYCYVGQDDNHYIALDLYLNHYKRWLIANNIVKEVTS